jgi:hypothetical protein
MSGLHEQEVMTSDLDPVSFFGKNERPTLPSNILSEFQAVVGPFRIKIESFECSKAHLSQVFDIKKSFLRWTRKLKVLLTNR